MALFRNSVDNAAGELTRLRQARERIEVEDRRDSGRLGELRGKLPEAELTDLLEGRPDSGEFSLDGAAGIRAEVFALESAMESRGRTRPVLMERIRAAMKDVAHQRAQELRKRAAELGKKLASHEARTSELLKQLEEHSGAAWQMRGPMLLPTGHIVEQPAVAVPRSAIMRSEIAGLNAEANRIEAQAVTDTQGGRVTGDSLDTLLVAAADRPLAPTETAIRTWHAKVRAAVDRAWVTAHPVGRPAPLRETRFILSWTGNGEIDVANSAGENHESHDLEAEGRHIAALQAKWFPPEKRAFLNAVTSGDKRA